MPDITETENQDFQEEDREPFSSNDFYCASCYQAFAQDHCPNCDKRCTPVQADDPIYLGELPGPLRNYFQIAIAATEIPFTAMPTLGLGVTMSTGDLLETYKIYVPYERSDEAREVLRKVKHPEKAEE